MHIVIVKRPNLANINNSLSTATAPRHFAIWLDLFEAAAREVLPAEKAVAFDTLARRIGRSLSMGIEQMQGGPVPFLRHGA